MTIYIDSDYKCHATNGGDMREVSTDFFNDKCTAYIEGYRFVPSGETWVREDGVEFHGEMISCWRPYDQLITAQQAYEEAQADAQAQLEDMREALEVLGVSE